jgi:hypothetical protein
LPGETDRRTLDASNSRCEILTVGIAVTAIARNYRPRRLAQRNGPRHVPHEQVHDIGKSEALYRPDDRINGRCDHANRFQEASRVLKQAGMDSQPITHDLSANKDPRIQGPPILAGGHIAVLGSYAFEKGGQIGDCRLPAASCAVNHGLTPRKRQRRQPVRAPRAVACCREQTKSALAIELP